MFRRTTVLFSYALLVLTAPTAGAVSLTTLSSAYTENFDTLAISGTANTIVPLGWAFSESGTNANTSYRAGTGSDNTGDTYSYGAAGSAERAFGGLQSGTLVPTIGAQFTNNTLATISSLDISYVGEQWRAGVLNRNAADRLDFQLSTDATSLISGSWTNYDSLDFNSPNILAAVGALDGNAAGNRAAMSFLISGLNIANGTSFWIRWVSFDITSADDGLAVDDFSLTPLGTPVPESGTLALLGLGLVGLALSRRLATLAPAREAIPVSAT